MRSRVRAAAGGLVVIAALVPAGLWLRDSSLVAVQQVTVVGIDGRQAPAIREALIAAGHDMTTLHVRAAALRTAVSGYPIVRSLRTSTDFPHGLRIQVNAYEPVGALLAAGLKTAVAADGTLLRGTSTNGLALVHLTSTPGTGRVTNPAVLGFVHLLATAPAPLRARVQQVFRGHRGLTTTLRDGPKLYFGAPLDYAAKWAAAARVLADGGARGARYVDVRLPERATAG